MIHVGGVGSIYGQWDGASVYYWGESTVGKDIENTTKISAARTTSKLQSGHGHPILKQPKRSTSKTSSNLQEILCSFIGAT